MGEQTNLIIIVDLVISIIMVLTVIWMFIILNGYGGSLGKAFRVITWGGVLMSMSHLIEIFGTYFPNYTGYNIMFLHRFLAVGSFILITYGFKMFI